jgi:hypothetical protein
MRETARAAPALQLANAEDEVVRVQQVVAHANVQRGGAVALAGVGIDDHDFDVGLLVLEVADGDGDVIENGVRFAVFVERVVGAAGEADADAFRQGGVTGEAGGLDLGEAALVKFAGDGQA